MQSVVVMSPRANVVSDVERNHLIKVGPSRIEPQVIPALSWGTPGAAPRSAQWSVSPPSTQTIVDRFVRTKIYLEVKSGNQAFQIGLNDALRQYPISSITDTITAQINGETVSQNSGDFIHALGAFGTDVPERNKSLSTTASQPDQYQEYSDWATYGSARNVMAAYGENATEQTRGGLDYKIAADGLSFRIEITEPLFLSPFFSGHGNEQEGMVNISQINLTIRWSSILSKIMSHSSLGGDLGTLDVSFYQAPELLLNYLSPDLTQQLPAVQTLPYSQQQEYVRPMGAVASLASTTVISDSVKLSMIPDRMYLFCRHSRTGMTEAVTDSFLKINRVRVNWNNSSSLLGTASSEQLYEMSSRAGLDMTYPQFSKYRGSVVCVQFGKDIGLGDAEAPGVVGQYTISTQIDVENTSTLAHDYEFFMVFSMGGTFSVFENGARASIGNLTQQEVLMARSSAPRMDYHEASRLSGGGFFDNLKKFANTVSKGVQSVAGVVGNVAGAIPLPFAQKLAQGANMVGDVAGSVRSLTGGRVSGGRVSGGAMSRRRM
jgi:hypothetical protein